MVKIIEKDIQNYLHKYYKKLPWWLKISDLQKILKPLREDLLFNPLKYLLYKKYQHIFNKMQCFEDSLYKFPKEYTTAEHGKGKQPWIDVLTYCSDPSTFFITEAKWNQWPERETLTELLQYANWIQINDFPWLSNDDIVYVVIAKYWKKILKQSVINWIIFKNLNILPIVVKEWKNNKFDFEFYDLWGTNIVKNLDKQIYKEENYSNRILAFDEFENWSNIWWLYVDYDDMKTITMMSSIEYSKSWFIGYILWMETESSMMYKNSISIMQLNPFSFDTKNWKIFPKKKQKELMDFSDNYNSCLIDTSPLKNIIKFHFPTNKVIFEEGDIGTWLEGLNEHRLIFSYWYPIGFLYSLIFDLIIYCREDKDFSLLISDDVDIYDQISHWEYLSYLFEIYKSWATNLEEYRKLKWINNQK